MGIEQLPETRASCLNIVQRARNVARSRATTPVWRLAGRFHLQADSLYCQ
ncbi:hypothetical protein ACROSR_01940 [Roseovarius tibetensis]